MKKEYFGYLTGGKNNKRFESSQLYKMSNVRTSIQTKCCLVLSHIIIKGNSSL